MDVLVWPVRSSIGKKNTRKKAPSTIYVCHFDDVLDARDILTFNIDRRRGLRMCKIFSSMFVMRQQLDPPLLKIVIRTFGKNIAPRNS